MNTTLKQLQTMTGTSAGSQLSAKAEFDSFKMLSDSKVDVLCRITDSQAHSGFDIATIETRNFYLNVHDAYLNELKKMESDVSTLKQVVKWQHNQIDYNSYYNAFLLEQVSESEFEEIAASFAYETKEIDDYELLESVRKVISLTEIEYPPSELAEFFRCDYTKIVEAYRSLTSEVPSLAHMIPASGLLSRVEP